MGEMNRTQPERSLQMNSLKKANKEEVAKRRAAMQMELEQRREAAKRLKDEKIARAVAQKKERLQKQREYQQREMLRAKAVLDRRAAFLAEEKERRAAILSKAHAAASRLTAQHKPKPVYAFGSSTPRELEYLTQLTKEQKLYDRRLRPPVTSSPLTTGGSTPGGKSFVPLRAQINPSMAHSMYMMRLEPRLRSKAISPATMTQSALLSSKTPPHSVKSSVDSQCSALLSYQNSPEHNKVNIRSTNKLNKMVIGLSVEQIHRQKTTLNMSSAELKVKSKTLLKSESPKLHKTFVRNSDTTKQVKAIKSKKNIGANKLQKEALNGSIKLEVPVHSQQNMNESIQKELNDVDKLTKEITTEPVDSVYSVKLENSTECQQQGLRLEYFTEHQPELKLDDLSENQRVNLELENSNQQQQIESSAGNQDVLEDLAENLIAKLIDDQQDLTLEILTEKKDLKFGAVISDQRVVEDLKLEDSSENQQVDELGANSELLVNLTENQQEFTGNLTENQNIELTILSDDQKQNLKLDAATERSDLKLDSIKSQKQDVNEGDELCTNFELQKLFKESVETVDSVEFQQGSKESENELSGLSEPQKQLEDSMKNGLTKFQQHEEEKRLNQDWKIEESNDISETHFIAAPSNEDIGQQNNTLLKSSNSCTHDDINENVSGAVNENEKGRITDERRRTTEERAEQEQREREERKAKLASIMSRTRRTPTAIVNPTSQRVIKFNDRIQESFKDIDSAVDSSSYAFSQTTASVLQKLATTNSRLLSVLQRNGSSPSLAEELSAADPSMTLPGQPIEQHSSETISSTRHSGFDSNVTHRSVAF